MGDNQYSNISDAIAGADWTDYVVRNTLQPLTRYVRPLYSLIYQTSSTYSNTPHARLIDAIDLSLVIPTGKQIDHTTLGGLQRDDHQQYVHNTIARTISAQHTFAPAVAEAPFVLGANALDQLVTGFNADYVDGHHATDFQANNVNLIALTTTGAVDTGLYVITGNGTSTTTSLASSGTTISVTNGNGTAGTINVDLPNVGIPMSNKFAKITTDAQGRVSANTAVISSDITGVLGYTPLNKAGDTMSGILNMGGSNITNVASPTISSDVATKSYVDGIATGLIWQQPVIDGNLVSDSASAPGSPATGDSYIIGTGGNVTVWGSFSVGDIVQWQGSSWVKVYTAGIGTRFAVTVTTTTVASGSFTGFKNYIVTITGGTPGAWTYSFDAPVNNWAVFNNNPLSVGYGESFTYSTALVQWVQFSSGINIIAGAGLYYAPSTTLNVGTASSSRITSVTGQIDLATTAVTPGTYTKVTVDAYGRSTFGANISSSDVTTALGYTPQTLNSNLTALSSLTTTGLYAVTGPGTSTTRQIVVPTGMSIANADGVSNNPTISLTTNLLGIENVSATGLISYAGSNNFVSRSIVVPTGMSIANADGVLSNPTISLTDNLLSIESLVTTGIVASINTSTYTTRLFSGQANQISIANGDLVAGNGTISLANNPIIPGTGAITVPTGTFAQQPSGVVGYLRYDTTTSKFEIYNGTWGNIATENYVTSTINTNVLIGGGDMSGSGVTGSNIAVTLNTVNTNVGTFAVTTLNGKGLVTAARNLVLTGDATGTSTGPNLVATLNTVNSNTGQWGDSSHVAQVTVNAKGLVTAAANIAIENLTGPITSSNFVTSVASQTGTGSTFVMNASPTLTGTPLSSNAAVNTNSAQIATTAFVVGQASGNIASNVAANVSSIGTSLRYSREDHTHALGTIGSGRVLQTVSTTVAAATGTSTVVLGNTTPTTSTGTNIASLSITPVAATSEVQFTGSFIIDVANNARAVYVFFFRGSTCVGSSAAWVATAGSPVALSFNFVDSPATTSSTSYTINVAAGSATTWSVAQSSAGARFGGTFANNAIILQELL